MVLDASAIVAVLTTEPGSERLLGRMSEADTLSVSAATVVDAGIVMQARYGDPGAVELDVFLHRAKVTVCPVTAGQAEIAREGFRRFGKGRHPAALNFGDCFSYALAVELGEPLLFVGSDFSRTDLPDPATGSGGDG